MLMLAAAAWASEILFLPTGSAPSAQSFSIEEGGVTLSFSYAMDNGQMIRVYKATQLEVTSTTAPIVKIEIICTATDDNLYGPGGFTVEPGYYEYEGKNAVWNGNSYRVVFTAANRQVRILQIIVTLDDGMVTLMSPVIAPAGGTYYAPIQVSMTCRTPDAEIYYTLDGSTPNSASTRYTEPFVLSENATVKAVSFLNGEVSDVAMASYDFADVSQVTCFEDWDAYDDSSLVAFASPVHALVQYNNRLYVQDECGGCAYFYGNTGHTYQNGDVIPAGFMGRLVTYSGERLLTNLEGFQPASGNIPIAPDTIGDSGIGHENYAHYVFIENVTISRESGYTYVATDANGCRYPISFGSMGVAAPNNLSIHYNIWAVVDSYGDTNTTYRLLPVKMQPNGSQDGILEITPSQVGPSTCGMQVLLRQVDYSYSSIWNLEGESCDAILTYTPILPAVVCWSYDIYGIVEAYNDFMSSGYRVNITGIRLHSGYDDIADVKRLKTLYKLMEGELGQYFNLSGHFTAPLTAVYQNGYNLYVKDIDGDFGYVVGSVAGDFRNGDIIYDALAKPVSNAGVNEVIPMDPQSFVPAYHSTAVKPDETSIANVDKNMMHHYVSFAGVRIPDYDKDTRTWTMTDGTHELTLYNYFGTEVTSGVGDYPSWRWDLNCDYELTIADVYWLISKITTGDFSPTWVGGDGTYDVEGFVAYHNGTVVIRPVKMVYHGGKYVLIADVNSDGEVNVADVNELIRLIIGQ